MHFINLLKCTIWTLLYGIINSGISLALRDVRVQIPHAVRKGEKAVLKCLYDLEGDSLYSVKWYKGRREFYSFTPKETPAMKVFQFAGVKVDRSSSNESQLVLETVNAATSGKYSCEVSADAPSFHTLIGAGELEVVVPGKDPVISGIRSRYKVGDIVRGNCTSSHSRPAANITWTINGYETNPAHVRHFKPHKDPRELETVISAIHFVVTPQHFIYGKLKIRCTAFIHDVYWKSTEKSIEENRLNKAGTSNVVHKFSEDYFDSENDNVIDRSDTYMTHIKGDVSSLNASGCSALHKCSCFWPRLTTLSLILYAVQQMLQLLQQLLTQTTTTGKTATITKQNTGNCRPIKTYTNNNNNEKDKNLLKISKATPTTTIATATTITKHSTIKQHASGSLETQVATICYKNKQRQRQQQQQNNNKSQEKAYCWAKEKHFQIELIKTKHEHLYGSGVQSANKKNCQLELQAKYTSTSIYEQKIRNIICHETQLQLNLCLYLQSECDKTLYESDNLTMTTTTQVANILPVNCTVTMIRFPAFVGFNMQQFICNKPVFSSSSSFLFSSTTSHNLNAFLATTTTTTTDPFNFLFNSLNTATCLNTRCSRSRCCTTATATSTGNSTSKDIFLDAATTTAATTTTTTKIITITTT